MENREPDGNIEKDGVHYVTDESAEKFEVGDLVASEYWSGDEFLRYDVRTIGHVRRSSSRFAEVYFMNDRGRVDSNNLRVVGLGTGWHKLKIKQ